jgi:diketogulonate reductase-like aldo/keto reductase
MPPPNLPALLYGTAWKKAQTAVLVHNALRAGFRGIDTAAQPRHYREDLVADGVRAALADGTCVRADLYIQTKFTPIGGQDPSSIPYDSALPPAQQVTASVRSSLANFSFPGQTPPYLDCVMLHSPLETMDGTLEAWEALAAFVRSGEVRSLGVSNTGVTELQALCERSEVRPRVVQSRFYPGNRWARDVRAWCRREGVVFQSFWTLTANPEILGGEVVGELAAVAEVDREVAMYALVMGLGEGGDEAHGKIVVLDGTTNEGRMKNDIHGVDKVGRWRESNGEVWEQCISAFRRIVDEAV